MLQLRTQYLSSFRRPNKFFWRQTLIERQLTIALIVEIFAAIYVPYYITCFNKLKEIELDVLVRRKIRSKPTLQTLHYSFPGGGGKIDTLFKTKILKNIPWLAARPH